MRYGILGETTSSLRLSPLVYLKSRSVEWLSPDNSLVQVSLSPHNKSRAQFLWHQYYNFWKGIVHHNLGYKSVDQTTASSPYFGRKICTVMARSSVKSIFSAVVFMFLGMATVQSADTTGKAINSCRDTLSCVTTAALSVYKHNSS